MSENKNLSYRDRDFIHGFSDVEEVEAEQVFPPDRQ